MWARTERWARAVVAGLLLVAAGCDQDIENTGRAGVESPHDLTLVNGYLFVISAAGDELKVLDTNSYPFDWVKAPNPLQPLSIPLSITGPTRLVADSDYAQDTLQDVAVDVPNVGPYVYAYNPAGSRISVIGTPGVHRTAAEEDGVAILDPRLHFVEVATIEAGAAITVAGVW